VVANDTTNVSLIEENAKKRVFGAEEKVKGTPVLSYDSLSEL